MARGRGGRMVCLKVVFGFAFAVPGVPGLAVIVYALWMDGKSIAFLSCCCRGAAAAGAAACGWMANLLPFSALAGS